MPMFAIGVVPLIRHLYGTARQVWYADDSAAAGSLLELRQWWDSQDQNFPGKKNKRKQLCTWTQDAYDYVKGISHTTQLIN